MNRTIRASKPQIMFQRVFTKSKEFLLGTFVMEVIYGYLQTEIILRKMFVMIYQIFLSSNLIDARFNN